MEAMQRQQQAAALNSAQMTMISQRTPQELIKTRKGKGGKVFSFVPHNYVTRLLNDAFCHAWSFEAQPLVDFCTETEITVKGRLTIHAPAAIVKEQFGSQEVLAGMTKGDALKGAGSDALRKCASLLGIALDLYGDDFPDMTGQGQQAQTVAPAPRRNEREEAETSIRQMRGQNLKMSNGQGAYAYFTRRLFEAGDNQEKLKKLNIDLYQYATTGEIAA